ncbi:MAG: terminase small subunit [Xanthomonadales bacterium]|nr:terminase small subunit [Xanthomonadales bacterium]
MSKLTPKQEQFIAEYLIDLNASQAAIRAGYSAKGASVTGTRLLANTRIASAIAKRRAEFSKRLDINQERVLTEYARIAFADVRRLYRDGNFIPVQQLDDDTAAAVVGIDVNVTADDCVVKVKMADKLRALDALSKHLGLFRGEPGDNDEDDKPSGFVMILGGS